MNPITHKYGAPLLPQVNLVPKDINDKRNMRFVQTVATIAVLAAIVLVGVVFAGAFAAKSVAKGNLDNAFKDEDKALKDRDGKASVYTDYVAQETDEFTLYQIGWADIDYSSLVTSIQAQDNSEVSIDSVHVYGPNAASIGGPETDPLFGGGVGTFDFVAFARTYEDGVALVERLEAVPGLAKVRAVTQSYESELPNISWEVKGTGVLTPLLLTHRLDPEKGIVDPAVIQTLLGNNPSGTRSSGSPTTTPAPTPTPEPTATPTSKG